MFSLIRQVFIILLSFDKFLTNKCVSLNHEPCMVKTTFIDLNPVELRYYPLMISLDTCSWSCNAFLPKICIPKKAKDINNKAFNKITNKIDAKKMAGHISCDSKYKFNSTTCNSNQKLFKAKNYHTFKEDYGWNPRHVSVRMISI